MGAFASGMNLGYSRAVAGTANTQAHSDALLEAQAAPIVEKLKDPNIHPDDANTLRTQLIRMYGAGQSHKAIAHLNDIYGVTPPATSEAAALPAVPNAALPNTGSLPTVDADGNPGPSLPAMPGGTSLPGQAGGSVNLAPKTVDEILASRPAPPLSPEEEHQAAMVKAGLTPKATADKAAAGKQPSAKDVTWLTHPDGTQAPYMIQDGQYVPVKGAEGMTPPAKPTKAAKLSALETQRKEYANSVLNKDPADMTFEEEQHFLASVQQAKTPTTSGTHEVAVKQPDGSIKMVRVSTTSSKRFAGADSGPSDRQSVLNSAPGGSGKRSGKVKGVSGAPAGGGGSVGRTVGGQRTPDQVKARETADTAELAYSNAQERLANPTPIGDTGLILSWAKTQIAGGGRMNNQEIERAIKSGSLGTRVANQWDLRTTGKLDDGFRKELVDDLGKTAKSARAQADKTEAPAPKSAKALKASAPTAAAPTKGKHSLATAMQLPFNKGKSADQVRADLEAHHYEVVP